jgi:hypothetical protein
VTRDVKARVRRAIGELQAIEQQQDPIFASPRDVFLELVLSIHELEAAAAKMRKAWWPPPSTAASIHRHKAAETAQTRMRTTRLRQIKNITVMLPPRDSGRQRTGLRSLRLLVLYFH